MKVYDWLLTIKGVCCCVDYIDTIKFTGTEFDLEREIKSIEKSGWHSVIDVEEIDE